MGGPVKLNGLVVFAFVARGGASEIRVRVSTDDWDRLGLCPGQQVRVEGPSLDGRFLLTAADEAPPVVWVSFLPLASRIAS
jgi:hypothetical protein